MKKIICFSVLALLSFVSYSQEFSNVKSLYIGASEVGPSLSILHEEYIGGQFTLPELNFNREQKREVNFIEVMKEAHLEKENSYIKLEAPMPWLGKGEKNLIQITNEIRIHDRSSNFDIYSGQKKIPAYEEMRVPLFRNSYYSGSRIRGYISPYSYSPFIR